MFNGRKKRRTKTKKKKIVPVRLSAHNVRTKKNQKEQNKKKKKKKAALKYKKMHINTRKKGRNTYKVEKVK